jgi:hypothetical protein
MDQRTAAREALPPFKAEKARGSPASAGTPDKYVDN